MKVIDLVNRLEALESRAGDQGWGGEYREEVFDEMVHYFKLCSTMHSHPSVGGLLSYLIVVTEKWFGREGEQNNA